jgi:hypothetical protein
MKRFALLILAVIGLIGIAIAAAPLIAAHGDTAGKRGERRYGETLHRKPRSVQWAASKRRGVHGTGWTAVGDSAINRSARLPGHSSCR